MKNRAILLMLALPSSALAQEHTVQIQVQKGQNLRTKIESSSKLLSFKEITIDGIELRRNGERAASQRQIIEFDEQILDGNQEGQATKVRRTYVELSESKSIRDGDSEEIKTHIEGPLKGRKVLLAQHGDKIVAKENDEDGAALKKSIARGLRVRTDLTGLLPEKAVAVGGEFELANTFRDAMANLLHPLAHSRQDEPDGEAADLGGGTGGRGAQSEFASRAADLNGILGFGFLTNERLTLEATGKLDAVSEGLATISFKAKAAGEGDPVNLGIHTQNRIASQRGEQSGKATPPDAIGNIECKVEGTLVVDLVLKRTVSAQIEGEFEAEVRMNMTREARDGKSADIIIRTKLSGSFDLAVAVMEATGN